MDRADETDDTVESRFRAWAAPRLAGLVQFGFALTHDEGAAEDLVQSALVRALVAWPRVIERDDPEAFVRRAMVDEQARAWRRQRRRPTVGTIRCEVESGFDADEAELFERDRVWRELVNVPPRERAVLVLRFYEDRSESEVAAVLDCSVATVRHLATRALAMLGAAEPVEVAAR